MHDETIVTLLTGQLPFILIVSAILALPLSWLLLWRYRKAVSRIMSERVDQPVMPMVSQPESVTVNHDESRLQLQFVDAKQWLDAGHKSMWRESTTIFRRVVCVYILAGFVFALVMAVSYLISGIDDIVMMQLIVMCSIFCWPTVLVFSLVATTSLRKAFFSLSFYFIIFLMIDGIVLVRNPHMDFMELLFVWATYNLLPTILLLAFLNKRIRAVGPMVWVFMFAAIAGSLVAMGISGANDVLLVFLTELGAAASLDATGIFVAILFTGFVVFSLLGWLLLRCVRFAYESRVISDQSLTVDSVMLIFAMYYAINLAFEGIIWTLSSVVAFVVYGLIVRIGVKYVSAGSFETKPLLVLRVFSLGKKSEALFQAITQRWRYLGNVQLIAGPDLATSTIEPHEFLTFLSGRLRQEFIHNAETLQQRLATLETQRDFDGRFRINELFCYADTWKQALAALVDKQNTVLMDLRSFTARKPGCIHELNTLVQVVPLNRVVLVVDQTTDLTFLSQVLHEAWLRCRNETDAVDVKNNRNNTIKVCNLTTTDDPVRLIIPWLCAASEEVAIRKAGATSNI